MIYHKYYKYSDRFLSKSTMYYTSLHPKYFLCNNTERLAAKCTKSKAATNIYFNI